MAEQPEVTAIREWFESEEGKRCTGGTASGQYLENRLWKAFTAGMNAGQRIGRAKAAKALADMITKG